MSTLAAYDTEGTRKESFVTSPVTAADAGTTFVIFKAPVAVKIEKINIIPAAAATGQANSSPSRGVYSNLLLLESAFCTPTLLVTSWNRLR